MEISPFSATIHTKNSAVTDKNGNQLHKPQENRIHVSKIKEEKIRHARDIFNLETKVEGALSDCDKMHQTNAHLEDVIKDLDSKLTASERRCDVELSNATVKQEIQEKDYKKQKQ